MFRGCLQWLLVFAQRQGRGLLDGIVETLKNSVVKVFHRVGQGFLEIARCSE